MKSGTMKRPISRQTLLVVSWHQMEREADPLFWGSFHDRTGAPYPFFAVGSFVSIRVIIYTRKTPIPFNTVMP
jgi:hypothetical protein